MGDKKNSGDAASRVVTSDKSNNRSLLPALKIVTVVAVCALIIGAAYYGLQRNDTNKSANNGSAQSKLDEALNKALADVEALGDSNPQSATERKKVAETYGRLGQAQMNKKDPGGAMASFENAIAVSPETKHEYLSELVYAYEANGQRDKAVKACQELLTLLKSMKQDTSVQQQTAEFTAVLSKLRAGQSL